MANKNANRFVIFSTIVLPINQTLWRNHGIRNHFNNNWRAFPFHSGSFFWSSLLFIIRYFSTLGAESKQKEIQWTLQFQYKNEPDCWHRFIRHYSGHSIRHICISEQLKQNNSHETIWIQTFNDQRISFKSKQFQIRT